MEGLPLLPGYSYRDPTITKYHLSHQFDYKNGYRLPRIGCVGIGKRPLDVDGTAYFNVPDPVRYDPSLTYGRVKQYAVSQVIPHFALYDKKCLTFRAFFKQSIFESPDEHYRIRHVNIIYFLEDDTITVMEPPVDNSGLPQGRLVRRNKIQKTAMGDYWHWKDFNIGIDVAIYGVVYHIVDCDEFTKEYLESQGIELNEPEEMPPDPYIQYRRLKIKPHTHVTKPLDDKLRRFLEYDGKILRFFAVWDDRETEYGEMRPYVIYYYLQDDRVEVQEVHDKNDGRDPFPLLLKKIKLPRDWKDVPVDFPTLAMETSEEEVSSYYTPKDFLVGETIFILGRRFLIYDTDKFTRKYFQEVLKITQKDRMDVFEKKPPPPENPIPPHLGFGSAEDSLQSCLTVTIPKPPRKDVVRYVYNINKNGIQNQPITVVFVNNMPRKEASYLIGCLINTEHVNATQYAVIMPSLFKQQIKKIETSRFGQYLRYEAVMDWVHPEDKERKFVFSYCLSDCSVTISEIPQRNSGFMEGTYLRATRIPKPGTNLDDPEFYTPVDFYIGALVVVFSQRFIITGADLFVYHYMETNPEKFPPQVMDSIRNYLITVGHLKEDIDRRACDMKKEEAEREHAKVCE